MLKYDLICTKITFDLYFYYEYNFETKLWVFCDVSIEF